ncbi:MAG TPA: ATP-binding protein [Actinomyces sp.]|nr:ATP-binding protein [Actinomyces sp.]
MNTNTYSAANIVGKVHLPPTAEVHAALSSNHSVATGLDELIDNAIDAEAKNIAIVFHTINGKIKRISVHDDGVGMDAEQVNHALRVGLHQGLKEVTIGRYGMGLKEASLSNSNTTTIVTRPKGEKIESRVLRKGTFDVDILDLTTGRKLWYEREELVDEKAGTSVFWDDLTQVYQGPEKNRAAEFLSRTITDVGLHIGLRYHKFIAQSRISIGLYTKSNRARVASLSILPDAINPFGYRKSGDPNYPLTLAENGRAGAPAITAHIWPKSKAHEFELGQRTDSGHQGFYIYDQGRLITKGGWYGYRTESRLLKNLRIEISDPRILEKYITVSPQKDSVRLEQEFFKFIRKVRTVDGSSRSIEQVIEDATEATRIANRHRPTVDPIVPAGRGLAPEIKQALAEFGRVENKEEVSIRWARTPNKKFIYLDKKANAIVLNQRFREAINPTRGRLNDAPVVKTLIFLLFNEYFRSGRAGSKLTVNTEFLLSVLNEAAEVELHEWKQYSGATFELFSREELLTND